MLAHVDGKAKGQPDTTRLHALRLLQVFRQRPFTIIAGEKK
jgi:hypothetical protein